MKRKIKEWYAEQKPDDMIVKAGLLNETVTFEDVYTALKERKDIYEIMACDSKAVNVIRKNADHLRMNVFTEMAQLYNCEYNDLYIMYLKKNHENEYTIKIPVHASVEIDVIGEDVNSSVEFLKAGLQNINCGILENLEIINPIDESNPLTDLENQSEELEAILLANTAFGEDPLSINFPVKADFLVTVMSDTFENAINKVKDNIQSLRIDNVGDLENISFDVNSIDSFENLYYMNEISNER